MRPAYLLADIEVIDAEAYEGYRKQVPAVLAAHGGRYLVRGGSSEVLEGSWNPRRTVIVVFPSMASLKAFYSAPEYQALLALRQRTTKSNVVAFEGI